MNLRHDLFRSGDFTFDDFCALVADDQKADLLDGVIYMASPDNTDAGDLAGWLYAILRLYAEKHGLGKVFVSRIAFKIDEHNSPEPDIGFVRQSRLRLVKRGHIAGAPDLAIEIVSPESVARDYIKKRATYENAGVREYWIVDEQQKKVILLRLTRAGKYREIKPRRGVLSSRVVTGFWLRPEWCWRKPLLLVADVLAEISKSAR